MAEGFRLWGGSRLKRAGAQAILAQSVQDYVGLGFRVQGFKLLVSSFKVLG